MKFKIAFSILLIGFPFHGHAQSYKIKEEVKRIVFLGNSITYAGQYITYIDAYLSIRYPQKNYEIINLHPSLLPKYKGLMTHKRMLINNEAKYGYSIHRVTTYLDDGKILSQNQKNISTYNENELSSNQKRLEHQCVFKDLVSFLN